MLDKVYEQSTNLIVKAAFYYYIEGMSQSEISELLGISVPTVSRILKKAKDKRIVEFNIPEQYVDCVYLETKLKKITGLKEVIISPCIESRQDITENEVKKNVALEGARYHQRIIRKEDILGIAWGRTMYYLIHYLNPSQKTGTSFVTLHGSITEAVSNTDPRTLVSRASMAFGGNRYSLLSKALLDSKEQLEKIWNSENGKNLKALFEKITISISGVGSWFPELNSPLAREEYLSGDNIKKLQEKNICADIMLHFIDRNGKECETELKYKTLTISLETYRKIPVKIVAASGSYKADSILALLRGNLVDVLIMDYELAKTVSLKLDCNKGKDNGTI